MISRLAWVFAALGLPTAASAAPECGESPGRVVKLCVSLEDGRAAFEVSRLGQPVLARSTLGLDFVGEPSTRYGAIETGERRSVDSTWEQPWGEERTIRDRHTEMTVRLKGDTAINSDVEVAFRLFDDGIGLRYTFRAVPAARAVAVRADRTSFHVLGDYEAWWYQALGQERDEYLYTHTDARRITLAETPLTLKGTNGLYLSFHEAALIDFPSMLLAGDGAGTLTAWLMPWPDGVLARKSGAFTTPWRTVLITDSAGALADSRIELNLNEPNKLGDVSWFKPGKFVGVWWEMHINKSTWESGPRHGATTANAERYMDFAAKYGFPGVLVEGWNQRWDGDWVAHGEQFSFGKPYPDFDLDAVAAYGRRLGVELIGHNETGGAVPNYEAQLEDAMRLYASHGMSVVKTGYVHHSGDILDEHGGHEWFANQYMVRHHLHVVEVAAVHHIAIDAHEPVKDTGLRRTWPNMVSREGARGQEYNAWGNPTNPPEHTVIIPFTRMLGGPMDFTPGIFDVAHGQTDLTRRVQSTVATQLAEYVVLYSPIQMVADLPENYEARPDAFQFIRDVPTDWETSKTLQGDIGEYIVVARLERGGQDWYLGALTNEKARSLTQVLSFLAPGRRYEAQIYRDGPGADFRTNPLPLTLERRIVTRNQSLSIDMAPGGGTAIRFKRLD
jgi:alpha-glucosidase